MCSDTHKVYKLLCSSLSLVNFGHHLDINYVHLIVWEYILVTNNSYLCDINLYSIHMLYSVVQCDIYPNNKGMQQRSLYPVRVLIRIYLLHDNIKYCISSIRYFIIVHNTISRYCFFIQWVLNNTEKIYNTQQEHQCSSISGHTDTQQTAPHCAHQVTGFLFPSCWEITHGLHIQLNNPLNTVQLTLKVLNFWKFTSYCSLKPLWSGMREVVLLVPRRPYIPHPLPLCINCYDSHFES